MEINSRDVALLIMNGEDVTLYTVNVQINCKKCGKDSFIKMQDKDFMVWCDPSKFTMDARIIKYRFPYLTDKEVNLLSTRMCC